MAGITLAEADAKLATWLAADDAVATGQAYDLPGPAGRQVTRADAKTIRENIDYWEAKVQKLSSTRTGIRCTPGTPL